MSKNKKKQHAAVLNNHDHVYTQRSHGDDDDDDSRSPDTDSKQIVGWTIERVESANMCMYK
jgi:hypothetical protein